MADLKYPAIAAKNASVWIRILREINESAMANDFDTLTHYAKSVRALIHESAKMLGHFAEGLPADNPDRQEAEALISRLGKTIGD